MYEKIFKSRSLNTYIYVFFFFVQTSYPKSTKIDAFKPKICICDSPINHVNTIGYGSLGTFLQCIYIAAFPDF